MLGTLTVPFTFNNLDTNGKAEVLASAKLYRNPGKVLVTGVVVSITQGNPTTGKCVVDIDLPVGNYANAFVLAGVDDDGTEGAAAAVPGFDVVDAGPQPLVAGAPTFVPK